MANHFIVYSVRNGVESFFKGITDPSFFVGINKILNDKLYLHYIDPLHDETHTFSGLLEFVCAKEGLDIADWLPFMKALQAQDDGSAAKKLYKRMLDLDNRLDPLVGSSSRVLRMPGHGEIGNGRKDESRVTNVSSTEPSCRNSQSYLLRRIARDAARGSGASQVWQALQKRSRCRHRSWHHHSLPIASAQRPGTNGSKASSQERESLVPSVARRAFWAPRRAC
jgi:hypothetical protein